MTDIFCTSPILVVYLHAAFAWMMASSSLSTTVVAITCKEEALHKEEMHLHTCFGAMVDRPLPHTFAAKKVLCIQLDLSGLEKCVACITRLHQRTRFRCMGTLPFKTSIQQFHLYPA